MDYELRDNRNYRVVPLAASITDVPRGDQADEQSVAPGSGCVNMVNVNVNMNASTVYL